MNKTQLIDAVAEKAEISKVDARKALESFSEVIGEALKAGDKVSFVGFGTFSVAERSARVGINPRTREKIQIEAKKVVKFKAGAEISGAVN